MYHKLSQLINKLSSYKIKTRSVRNNIIDMFKRKREILFYIPTIYHYSSY